ncbi:hypothetical protein [Microbacterium sp. zg-YB36]|uniref:hypothetical protein n=1 Tax=Microbacterium sp. zg-YB36 TaxID=2969407 RepID=UPI00214CE744|nr:hypothetical protein [Microbacterium sp. zg-YB36]MDL5351198.1 hypothetical protein [Microbacterium sp. zg-YB36]
MNHPEYGPYRAIINLDDRKRAPVGRFATREPVEGWEVYRSADGREILLKAIVNG